MHINTFQNFYMYNNMPGTQGEAKGYKTIMRGGVNHPPPLQKIEEISREKQTNKEKNIVIGRRHFSMLFADHVFA